MSIYEPIKYCCLCLVLFVVEYSWAQKTPDFSTVIYFQDNIGNIDSILFGYDSRASYDSLSSDLGEKLIVTPFQPVLDIRAFHSGDKDRKYPTKVIIANFEEDGGECPFYEDIYVYVNCENPPLRIYWNSDAFPSRCNDIRSEIISQDIRPLLIREWWRATNYICMSFRDSLVDDFKNRDPFNFIQDSFLVEGVGLKNLYGYMLTGLGFGECKQLVSVDQTIVPSLKLKTNLVHNRLRFQLDMEVDQKLKWRIISINGEIPIQGEGVNSPIDISGLETGVYAIVVFQESQILFSEKFIKQ
jgi:hypothetical protein